MNTLTKIRKEAEVKHKDINNRFNNFEKKVKESNYDLSYDEMNSLLDEIVEGL